MPIGENTMKREAIHAKFVFNELTLEDLIPVFRKSASIIVATQEDCAGGNAYDCWDTIKKTFYVTNSDGETEEEEQDDDGEFVLFSEDSEGPTFWLKQKVRLEGNRVWLVDDNFQKYTLDFYKDLNLEKMLMPKEEKNEKILGDR